MFWSWLYFSYWKTTSTTKTNIHRCKLYKYLFFWREREINIKKKLIFNRLRRQQQHSISVCISPDILRLLLLPLFCSVSNQILNFKTSNNSHIYIYIYMDHAYNGIFYGQVCRGSGLWGDNNKKRQKSYFLDQLAVDAYKPDKAYMRVVPYYGILVSQVCVRIV